MGNMGREDTFSPSGEQAPSGGGSPSGRVSIDRFEMKHQFLERSEEEKVEAAAALYERAAMQWMQSGEPPEGVETPESEEELEARSQELKLRQKCQDIAALMMVEELEDNEDM